MGALGAIVACGAYVPRLRLARATIGAATGWLSPANVAYADGARAICNWDEDALTLAVEAARSCRTAARSRGFDEAAHLRALTLASTTLPFADRSNAAVAAGALDLAPTIETTELGGSLRAGTSALAGAARRGDGGATLVVASDARLAKPGSQQELDFGAGAAAVLVQPGSAGPPKHAPLATMLAVSHLSADFVDHYRSAGEAFDYAVEERWVRDEAYGKLVPVAIRDALGAADLAPSAVNRLIVPAGEGIARRVAQSAQLEHAALQNTLWNDSGHTGAAHALLLLAAALEATEKDETLVLVGFGQGVDALVLRAHAGGRSTGRGPVAAALARRAEEKSYVRYLSHAGLVDVDFGMRAERDHRTALSVAWRKHRQVAGFVGGRCSACGTVQFPKSRVCVNPDCRRTDTQSDAPLADSYGRVKSFTEDWQAYSPRPPYIYGNVELLEGGNLLMEITDHEAGEIAVGDRVRFVFRVKDIDRPRAFRRYFWKATKA